MDSAYKSENRVIATNCPRGEEGWIDLSLDCATFHFPSEPDGLKRESTIKVNTKLLLKYVLSKKDHNFRQVALRVFDDDRYPSGFQVNMYLVKDVDGSDLLTFDYDQFKAALDDVLKTVIE